MGQSADELREEYKAAKKTLRKSIQESKKEHWKNLCETVKQDIWGEGYKIIVKKMGYLAPYDMTNERKKEIIEILFSTEPIIDPRYVVPVKVNLFKIDELQEALSSMKNGKAPGIDGIPAEALKEVAKVNPKWLLNVMNELLQTQSFPEPWKLAKVVLILKKGKSPEHPKSYRPIALLNTLGKLYEALVRERLSKEIDEKGLLSERQYGFRKGKSTLNALEDVQSTARNSVEKWLVLVLIDIENAFNSADWDLILAKLQEKSISEYLINVIRDYLSQRKLSIGPQETIDISAGVPQGSILGPILWDVLYDGVLRLILPAGCRIRGFADDLGLTVSAKNAEVLNRKVNICLNRINDWLMINKLKIAPHKCEAVILKGPRNREGVKFKIANHVVDVKNEVNYLGVTFDSRGSFSKHIEMVAKKAEKKAGDLARIMPTLDGPSSQKRKVLCEVLHSILLYAAPIWISAIKTKKYSAILERAQRKGLLRIASAFRTTSTVALQVITATVPIDLLAMERACIYEGRHEATDALKPKVSDVTLARWQQRWDANHEKAQWTKRLIPDISKWVKCRHIAVDYYMTQALTGHGVFRAYAKRFKKDQEDTCIYCGVEDNVEHTLFICNRWQDMRQRACNSLGTMVNPENLIKIMVESEDQWNVVHNMIKNIMRSKEIEERRRQANET